MMSRDRFKISVVIAHYNAGNYIRKALDSLVNQTMNQEDFEVIIVDDKSTQPLNIIRQYEAKIKNLKILVEDKNNGYPSIPRNHGIDVAEGIFILLMDQDDNLAKDTLQKFFSFAGEDSDIVIGKYAEGNGYNGTQVPFEKGNIKNVDVTKDHIVSTLAPHKMYRKSMLNKYKLRFFDSSYIPVAEDQVFNMKAYSVARKISILADKDYYYWNQRDDFGNLGKSKAYVYDEPWKYLNVISEIFKSIETSPVWNEKEKMRLKAIYIGRIFNSNGTVIKTIRIQNSDLQRATLVNGLRKIINESMDDNSISDVRQICQWMVCGIKYGMSYNELLDFQSEVYMTSYVNNIAVREGKSVRNINIKGHNCFIPIDFLNHEIIRLTNINYLDDQLKIAVSIHNDLHIAAPNNIDLLLLNRQTKEQFSIGSSKIQNNRITFLLDYKKFINSKIFQDGVFDFFVEVQRASKLSRYRLGNNKNILLSKPALISFDKKKFKFYYTETFSNLSMVIG